ncbi:unnamed protein product [Oikopleura dioica]|uniref:C2H2-type domain-containing protein n=1 Tax=Oikopleura dioica TaxID=34765 RepID=E4YKJ6_OIKDI|nr:unnamed protein product [Oikopleura dioica]
MSSDKKRKKLKKKRRANDENNQVDTAETERAKSNKSLQPDAQETIKSKIPASNLPQESDSENEQRELPKKKKKQKKHKEQVSDAAKADSQDDTAKRKKKKKRKRLEHSENETEVANRNNASGRLSFAILPVPSRAIDSDDGFTYPEDFSQHSKKVKTTRRAYYRTQLPASRQHVLPSFSLKTQVPDEFYNRMRDIGVPEENIAIFYHVREKFDNFNELPDIYCTYGKGCCFRTRHGNDCLTEHCQVFHGYGSYPCIKKDCNYVGYSKRALANHTTQFHGTARKKLSSKIDLENPMLCPVESCNGIFQNASYARIHERTHSNQMDTCFYCGARYFFKTSRWHHHLFRHLDIMTYPCTHEGCDKWFFAPDKVTEHMNKKHQTVERFECDCGESFLLYDDRKKHRISCEVSIKIRNPHLFSEKRVKSKPVVSCESDSDV